jgi:hypothetical protein
MKGEDRENATKVKHRERRAKHTSSVSEIRCVSRCEPLAGQASEG